MEPVSRSTNGTHAPAPAAAQGAPGDPADPGPAPASAGAGESPAPPAPRPRPEPRPPALESPSGSFGPAPLDSSGSFGPGSSGGSFGPAPVDSGAGASVSLGSPRRGPGSTWWGGPQRNARPLDRISGISQSLVGDALLRHVAGCRVLDLGVGSPEIARWVRATAASLESLDVRLAADDAGQIRLPQPSDLYDVVYSVRTLAHLGHDEASSDLAVQSLLAEATRILLPGGLLLVEINNPRSLRGFAYGIRRPITVATGGSVVLAEKRQVTRYDTLSRLMRLAPRNLELAHVYGIRVLVPFSRALQIPLLGRLLAAGEWWARDSFLRGFGAHLLVALRKHDDPVLRVDPKPPPTG